MHLLLISPQRLNSGWWVECRKGPSLPASLPPPSTRTTLEGLAFASFLCGCPPAPNQSLKEGIIPPITLGMLLAPWLHPSIWHLGESRANAKPCALGGSFPGTSHQTCPGRAACPALLRVEPRTSGRGIVEGEQDTGGCCSGWGQGPGLLLCGFWVPVFLGRGSDRDPSSGSMQKRAVVALLGRVPNLPLQQSAASGWRAGVGPGRSMGWCLGMSLAVTSLLPPAIRVTARGCLKS